MEHHDRDIIRAEPGEDSHQLEQEQNHWLAHLKRAFREAIETEHNNLPKISLDIYFGYHSEAEDVTGEMEERFSRADLFIPEYFAWSPKNLENLRSVCQGTMTADDYLQKAELTLDNDPSYHFRKRQLEMIYHSTKPLTLIDVPSSYHRVVMQVGRMQNNERDIYREIEYNFNMRQEGDAYQTSFETLLGLIKYAIKWEAEIEQEREEYMITHLPVAIKEALIRYPSLQGKQELNAFLTLGTGHTRVYHGIKRSEDEQNTITASRKFQYLPMALSHRYEGTRRYLFEKTIDDELAAKILLEHFIAERTSLFSNIQMPRKEYISFLRKGVDSFSLDEIREMFQANLHLYDFFHLIERKLDEKGIKAPE